MTLEAAASLTSAGGSGGHRIGHLQCPPISRGGALLLNAYAHLAYCMNFCMRKTPQQQRGDIPYDVRARV